MRDKMTVKINLHKLGYRICMTRAGFISVSDIVYELGVTHNSAGRILSALARLGYVEKWNNKLYKVKSLRTRS